MTTDSNRSLLVGVISDTHGQLSAEAASAFLGVDHILHAGDVVSSEVIGALQTIAPTTAVMGNMDDFSIVGDLPRTAVVELNGAVIYVLHDLYRLDLDPHAAQLNAVIHGHTHRPSIDWRQGVLFLNPGSAGPPRSNRPPTVALLTIALGQLIPKIVRLDY